MFLCYVSRPSKTLSENTSTTLKLLKLDGNTKDTKTGDTKGTRTHGLLLDREMALLVLESDEGYRHIRNLCICL